MFKTKIFVLLVCFCLLAQVVKAQSLSEPLPRLYSDFFSHTLPCEVLPLQNNWLVVLKYCFRDDFSKTPDIAQIFPLTIFNTVNNDLLKIKTRVVLSGSDFPFLIFEFPDNALIGIKKYSLDSVFFNSKTLPVNQMLQYTSVNQKPSTQPYLNIENFLRTQNALHLKRYFKANVFLKNLSVDQKKQYPSHPWIVDSSSNDIDLYDLGSWAHKQINSTKHYLGFVSPYAVKTNKGPFPYSKHAALKKTYLKSNFFPLSVWGDVYQLRNLALKSKKIPFDSTNAFKNTVLDHLKKLSDIELHNLNAFEALNIFRLKKIAVLLKNKNEAFKTSSTEIFNIHQKYFNIIQSQTYIEQSKAKLKQYDIKIDSHFNSIMTQKELLELLPKMFPKHMMSALFGDENNMSIVSNNSSGLGFRFMYSEKWAWIDLKHFFKAYFILKNKELSFFGPMSNAFDSGLIYHTLAKGRTLEWFQGLRGNLSSYSHEDLFSNILGCFFYLYRYQQKQLFPEKNDSAILKNFLDDLDFKNYFLQAPNLAQDFLSKDHNLLSKNKSYRPVQKHVLKNSEHWNELDQQLNKLIIQYDE